MCYSAQVIQVARKIYRELGIRIDYAEVEKLFFRRLDDPGITISRGFEQNFEHPTSDQERRIKEAIDEHRSRRAKELERELFKQRTRLVNASRSLTVKETRKAREDLRIATGKIEAVTTKLSDQRRSDPLARDDRIFPMVYTGVIVRQEGKNVLTPMRYGCRPAGKPSDYDRKFPGLYNARRDNLERFWRAQFGLSHAILVIESFYENVRRHTGHQALDPDEKEHNVVLHFAPNPPQTMLVACLWSHWTGSQEPDVRGFAAITDDPPATVAAAGHDRCIINLRPEHVEAWLTPERRTAGELQAILSDRAVSVFDHEVLKAA